MSQTSTSTIMHKDSTPTIMRQKSTYPTYPPELTVPQTNFLVSQIKDWCIGHGLAFRPGIAYTEADAKGNYVGAAPITMFPSLFPLACFKEALSVQKAYNEIYAGIASDEEWLESVAAELADVDDFIAKLLEIHLAVKNDGYAQDISLGLFRSDYLAHQPLNQSRPTIRQVEFNTIASGMGGLSSRVSSLHRHLRQTASYPDDADHTIEPHLLPKNPAIEDMGLTIAKAHAAYGPSQSDRPTCILFIVQEQERNAFDQRLIEYSVSSQSNALVFRVCFNDILRQTTLDGKRNLVFSPPSFPGRSYEVTTVYYRAGYSPREYTSEESWAARLHIERSSAIKCPSVLLHLAGCKKVQQLLATPDSHHLAKFLRRESSVEQVKNTFASIYPMDTTAAGLEGRKLATDPKTAQRFVLKPQREGGGNNVYRTAIPEFLKQTPQSLWPAYILMEMIEAPAQENIILREGETQKGGVVCELGVFGSILWRRGEGGKMGEVFENREIGHVLRTKGSHCEEGGISAGLGALDSVCLIDV